MTALNKYKIPLLILLGTVLLLPGKLSAQQKTDTVILNVGKSKIVFLIKDKEDLKSMQNYDLNEILDQLSFKLTGDSTLIKDDGEVIEDTTVVVDQRVAEYNEENEQSDYKKPRRRRRGTQHEINFDLGVNNYVTDDGKFPDETNELYTVKPWGSWYVGISSIYKTPILGPLYLEWGAGVSWYNFKFENTRATLIENGDQAVFVENFDPTISFEKSKLTVAYLHFSAVPMLDFGKRHNKGNSNFWQGWWSDNDGGGFRLGAGVYGGYRIDSYTKIVFDDDKKDRDHNNYQLENFRYGVRLQMGYRGTDLFFNYDVNELFAEGKGPKLNAFSFGIIL